MVRIAWSSSHQEFLISDSYYFSDLAQECRKHHIVIEEVSEFDRLFSYEAIVFNYPEQPFTGAEIEVIKTAVLRDKKRVLLAAHFQNKDNVARICSQLARHFGLLVLEDGVFDPENHMRDDPFLIITTEVGAYNDGVRQVVFPYSAPLELLEPAKIVLKSMKTATTGHGQISPVLAAEKTYPGGGSFVLLGSCVFWDNFSLSQADNLRFALNLLKGPDRS
ncbi:MAG: hypothetical protein ACPLQP_07910 [Moorellaceae bacterium]